jgi:hypothetical protein
VIGTIDKPGGERAGHIERRRGELEYVPDGRAQHSGNLHPRARGGRGTITLHNHATDGGSIIPGWLTDDENDAVTLDSPKNSGGPGGMSMIIHNRKRVELYVDKDGVITAETFGDLTPDELDQIFGFLNNGQKVLARRAQKRRARHP